MVRAGAVRRGGRIALLTFGAAAAAAAAARRARRARRRPPRRSPRAWRRTATAGEHARRCALVRAGAPGAAAQPHRRGLRLPRPARLGAPARRARAPAHRAGGRGARPARGALPSVGRAGAGRPRDRRADRGRHLRPPPARALRRAAAEERAAVAAELRRAGAEHVVLSTEGAWARSSAGGSRELRLARLPRRARAGAAGAGGPRAGAPARAPRTRCASRRSATLSPLLARVSTWRRRLPLALFLAALAACSLALARPHATVAVPQEQASIVLVTDVSRSMLADDVEPEPPRGRALGGASASSTRCPTRPASARSRSRPTRTRVEPPTDDRGEVGRCSTA